MILVVSSALSDSGAEVAISNSEEMKLTVSNISNELAKRNAVFISSQLAKDPSRTVNVRVDKSKILKCAFLPDIDRSKIGMSKSLRTFVGTDLGQDILAEPISAEQELDYDMSLLQLELDQVLPKLSAKTKVDAVKVTEALRKKGK